MAAIQGFSRTAFMSGATRATHVMWDPAPHVLNDAFTALVLPNEFSDFVKNRLQRDDSDLNPAGRASVVWRARTAEDALERSMSAGVRQYAVLGAGLDSFGWRRSDLLPGLQVFEIDHPVTQEWKRACMARAGIPAADGLHYVPADLSAMRLGEALAGSSWDFARPGFFCWTGVTMYLHPEAVLAALRDVAALGTGTTISLTYLQPEHLLDGIDLRMLLRIREASESVGEPYYSYYAPDEIEDVARKAGFTRVEHHDPRTSPHFAGRSDGLMPHRAELLVVATV